MAKITLTDIAAGYSLIATINANNALIETALENTLSRDGTTPNTMSAALDMNSQAMNNLPDATAQQSPVTLAQLQAYAAASLTTVAGSVVQIADANSDWIATTLEGVLDGLQAGTEGFENLAILDSARTDKVVISHDGTDLNIVPTNTTDIDFGTGLGLRYMAPNDVDSFRFNMEATHFASNTAVVNGWRMEHNLHMREATKTYRITWWDGDEIDNAGIQVNDPDLWLVNSGLETFRMDMPIKIKELNSGSLPAATANHGMIAVLDTDDLRYRDAAGNDFEFAYVKDATSAALNNVANNINTVNKFRGASVFNTDLGYPVFAAGNLSTSVWVDATGVTRNTPV